MRQFLSITLLTIFILFLSTGCSLKKPEAPQEEANITKPKVQTNVKKLEYYKDESMLVESTPPTLEEMLKEEPSAVGEFQPALSPEQAAAQITEEALKAKEGKRALPLIAHWDTGAQSDLEGMSPDFMISLIEEGHHILPSWELDPYWASYIPLEYYEASIKRAAELNLPLVFVSDSFTAPLMYDPYFVNLKSTVNPNLIDTNGNHFETLSPMGHSYYWKRAGQNWVKTDLMKQLQEWYPNPPLVVFLSRNEADRLNWTDLQRSQRYVAKYGTTQSDDDKRKFIGDAWFERYRALQEGAKKNLSEAWSKNTIFVGRNTFPDTSMGKTDDWMNHSTYTKGTLSVWPLIFDGSSQEFVIEEGEDDISQNSPHIRANNMPFMLEDTKFLNDDFWWEATIGGKGILDQPERYRGFTQFDLWLNRPSVVRESANNNEDNTTIMQHFVELIDSVEMIHNSDLLQDFWKNGTLVKNPNAKNPYNKNIPEMYRDEMRWYMLDTDQEGIWAFALVKGEEPNREWLVFVQSGDEIDENISVRIPDYQDVTVSVSNSGEFFVVEEIQPSTSLRSLKVSTATNTLGLKEPQDVNINDLPSESIVWLEDLASSNTLNQDLVSTFKKAVEICNNSDVKNVIALKGNYPIKSYAVGQTGGAVIKKDLTIIGESKSIFDVHNNLSIEAPLILQTSITDKLIRGSLIVSLESVENIKDGDLFVIESDKVAETGWGYKANDISPIVSVNSSDNTITLLEKPNFSYDTNETIKVKIYKNVKLNLYNIATDNKSEKHSLRFTGFSEVMAKNIAALDPDKIREGSNGIMFTQSYALSFKNLTVDGGLYPFLILNSRKILVNGIDSQNSRHPFDTAMFSSDIEVMNVKGLNNTSTVECHPSFNVYWHDVEFTDDTQLPTMRSTGIKLNNITGNSVHKGNYSTQWSVNLADKSILSEYENVIQNFHIKTPFSKFLLSHNARMPGTFENCAVYGIRISKDKDGFIANTTIKDSTLSYIETSGNIEIYNSLITKNPEAFLDDIEWALTLDSNKVYVKDTVIDGYRNVVNFEYIKDSITWENVTFRNISSNFRGPTGAGIQNSSLTWIDPVFENVASFENYNESSYKNKITVTNPTFKNSSDTFRSH